MKKIVIAALIAVTGLSANAALLFQETFDHPADSMLYGNTPEIGSVWNTNGTTYTYRSNLVSGSLSAPAGFAASSGNSVKVGKASPWTGYEAHSKFTDQTGAGTVVYMSYLVNVSEIASGKGGAVIGLSPNSAAEYASLFITNTVGNSYATFGLGNRSTVAGPWASSLQVATGTTYLIVVSYEFVSGTGNDVAKMWINPDVSTFGGSSAPAYDLMVTITAGDAALLNTVEIKNSSAMPIVQLDEIRVGTTWADVTPIPEPATVGMLGLGALTTLTVRRFRNR